MRLGHTGSVFSTYNWNSLDYYCVGYVIANSLCKWELNFRRSSMEDEKIEMLCEGIMDCQEITEKGSLIHADFSDNDVKNLKYLAKIPRHIRKRIVSLDFSQNKLNKEALNSLSQIVPDLSMLQILELSINSDIGKGGAKELMEALSLSETPLKELGLQVTSIGEEDIEMLCPPLE